MSMDYDYLTPSDYESPVRLLAKACTELREVHKHLEIIVVKLEELIKAVQPGPHK